MFSKTILFLAFSLFVFCNGEEECGVNQCRDLWTAKKCNKVKYCIEEEWSKLKPTGNRDNVCEICLKMVKEARDTLRSNETREELLEVFEGSCRLLFFKPAVELCDNLVDDFVPELVEILSSQMDPETVCTIAKLCNNEVFAAAQKNSKGCIYCESFTESLASQMNTISSEQFKNKIVNQCRAAGSFSDACYFISSIYSDSFYNNAKSILSRKPCEATSLCPSGSLHPQSFVKIKKKMCPLCRNVMTSLKKQLLNVKSAEEFAENMFSICEKFNFPYHTCLKVSSPALYKKLKNTDTPNLLCRMTFCNDKPHGHGSFRPLVPSDDESFSLTREMDPLELLENFEMFYPELNHEKPEMPITTEAPVRPTIAYGDPIDNPLFFAPSLFVPTSNDCKTCSHVFGMLESRHPGLGYSDDMTNAICNNAENVTSCKEFVNNFSHILNRIWTVGVPSKKMCEDLVPSCIIKQDDSFADPKRNSTCNLCLNSVKILRQAEPEFWNDMEEKCNELPANSQNICKFAFSNIPAILRNYDGNEICDIAKLCGPSAVKFESITDVEVLKETNKSNFCRTCISTVEEIVDLAKKNESALIVRVVLESICFMMPPEDRKLCTHFIEVVGVEKIIRIIEQMNPTDTCTKIHFCRPENKTESSVEIIGVKTEEKIPCKFCLMAIKTLLDELEDDKTEQAIRKALDGLCQYFPEETRDTCRTLIDEYTEDIIDMIIADFNATEICMYLKICPHSKISLVSVSAESAQSSNKNNYIVFDVETNQILDWIEKPTEEVAVEKPTQADLDKLHEYVKECALCEALVGVIRSHEIMRKETYDFSANADHICSIVPDNDKGKCITLLVSYGPSIRNLLGDKKVDINEICVYVDLCDPKMQAKVNQPVVVQEDKYLSTKNECAKGPRFWCANAENAEKCGTFLHCQETVWKNWKNPPRRPTAH